jgi:hypothetical protein
VKRIDNPLLAEVLLDAGGVVVRRVNGRARDGVDGRHKRAVIYCGATVSSLELAKLLRESADRLERVITAEAL